MDLDLDLRRLCYEKLANALRPTPCAWRHERVIIVVIHGKKI